MRAVISLVVAAAVAAPFAAAAPAPPREDQYGNQLTQVVTESPGGPEGPSLVEEPGFGEVTLDALPFTGTTLLSVAVLGVVLVAAGFVLRARRQRGTTA